MNVFALLRLLPMSDRDKDAEILALRHQITVLERQLGNARPRLLPSDRAFLAALRHRLPHDVLGRFRLLVRPDTVLRWHRDLLARRHAARSRPKRPGRPRTARSIRQLVLRLARENPAYVELGHYVDARDGPPGHGVCESRVSGGRQDRGLHRAQHNFGGSEVFEPSDDVFAGVPAAFHLPGRERIPARPLGIAALAQPLDQRMASGPSGASSQRTSNSPFQNASCIAHLHDLCLR